jgi:hypothetical protein
MALIHDRNLWPRQSFDPSCPNGGFWHVCTTGSRFVGCCSGTVDPCDETTSCPQKNLRPASFDVAEYGTFPDQTCSADSHWYTCAGTNPAFMGCCKSNPCSSGCPTKDLSAASLSVDEAVASAFIAASPAAASSTAAATTMPAAPFSAGDHVGAIAGGAIGGVAGICLVAIGVIWCMKRQRQSRKRKSERQKLAQEYKNDDGHFHNTYIPRQVYTPNRLQPEDIEEPRRTVYSMEDPGGIEVDDRPVQSTSTRPSTSGKIECTDETTLFRHTKRIPTDQYLASTTQHHNVSPNISRPPSVGSPYPPPSVGNPPSIGASWFTRDSIFANGNPQLANIPSPDENNRASWIEQSRYHNNSSPMVTPLHSPLHNATHSDYFGAYENHNRNTSHASRLPISPQNQYFELDDTQLSPPVELEAIEAVPKNSGESTWQSVLQQPVRRRSRPDVDEEQTGSAYFSPDDVGKPQSRG